MDWVGFVCFFSFGEQFLISDICYYSMLIRRQRNRIYEVLYIILSIAICFQTAPITNPIQIDETN
jgi:hypothetical protein